MEIFVEDRLHKVLPILRVRRVHSDLPARSSIIQRPDIGHCLLRSVGKDGELVKALKGALRQQRTHLLPQAQELCFAPGPARKVICRVRRQRAAGPDLVDRQGPFPRAPVAEPLLITAQISDGIGVIEPGKPPQEPPFIVAALVVSLCLALCLDGPYLAPKIQGLPALLSGDLILQQAQLDVQLRLCRRRIRSARA